MDYVELARQREIGKQILLIRIIHGEKQRLRRIGFSCIDRHQISEWMQLPEENLSEFFADISRTDKFNISVNAAKEYAKNLSDGNAYAFFLSTFVTHGRLYVANRILETEENDVYSEYQIEELAKVNAMNIAEEGTVVCDELKSGPRFLESLNFYFDFYIGLVKTLIDKGYDWDVVTEMLEEKCEFVEQLKKYVAAK